MFKEFLQRPESASVENIKKIADEIMNKKLTSAQIGAFLIALKLSGREVEPAVVSCVAQSMRDAAIQIPDLNFDLIDIVGTGGDGQNTFNVSTAASIVVAGAGCKVAKHGNRASSSSCGSADVLEALNCNLTNLGPADIPNILSDGNFCFLYAPTYHPSMRHVSGPRKELGVRTIFNLLGPLTNPAKPKRIIVGVFSKAAGPIMAQALRISGIERGWVVHGEVGLDEISPQGKTFVWELDENTIVEKQVCPADFGLPEHPLEAVKGGDAVKNAEIMDSLLSGDLKGPILDFVLLNSSALLYVAGKASDLKSAVGLAKESINSKKAKEQLDIFRQHSQSTKV